MKVRVLLLQARTPDDPVRDEERRSFARMTGLGEERIETHDLLDGPPSLARVQSFDAMMVGGSGDFYVSKRDLPHVDATYELLGEVVDAGHPTFASCFGFQLLIDGLGGTIVHDPERMEVGTFEMSLTEAGAQDPVFGTLPAVFRAQCGRKDRADSLPEGFVKLAGSARCPYHAIRVEGRPVWSTQFHPELDRETNRSRFERYLAGYGQHLSEDELEATLARFDDSPEACGLLRHFLRVVFE